MAETSCSKNNTLTEMIDQCVIGSAPGKVLITGGYLVLERPNCGMVLATDACLHAKVGLISTSNDDDDNNEATVSSKDEICFDKKIKLNVYSPQFFASYKYWVLLETDKKDEADTRPCVQIIPRDNHPKRANAFLERVLVLSLSYFLVSSSKNNPSLVLEHLLNEPKLALAIQWNADSDFYSSITPPSNREEEAIVHKTGLGSSAALVTSTVAALWSFFSTHESTNEEKRNDKLIHGLAQAVHGWAQGKIGSGFDVSAAVYGSHVYTRFSKSLLQPLFDSDHDNSCNSVSHSMAHALHNCVQDENDSWNSSVQTKSCTNFPFQMLLVDVCGGSESPSMARKVMEWKKNNDVIYTEEFKNNENPWTKLQCVNHEIHQWFIETADIFEKTIRHFPNIMNTLARFSMDTYEKMLSNETKHFQENWNKLMTEILADEIGNVRKFESRIDTKETLTQEVQSMISRILQLRSLMLKARKHLKEMGNKADVPIEPDEQTKLANNVMSWPGVIIAGVPGAGGYDALYVLYIGEETSNTITNQLKELCNTSNNNDTNEFEMKDKDITYRPLACRQSDTGLQVQRRKIESMEWYESNDQMY